MIFIHGIVIILIKVFLCAGIYISINNIEISRLSSLMFGVWSRRGHAITTKPLFLAEGGKVLRH